LQPLADLRRAAKDALAYASAQPDVEEVEVFVSANANLTVRLNCTSHIPSNGVEEPKSTDSHGLGPAGGLPRFARTVEPWQFVGAAFRLLQLEQACGASLMGTFSVPIAIGNPGGTQYETVDALVDTGASYTVVPNAILQRLRVTAHDHVTFILADGREIQRDVGRTWIRVGEKSEITLVVFGDDGTEPLLGAYALQGLLLAVDTPNEQLVPVPGLLKRIEPERATRN
jgi:clan AA aspartic protease